MSLPANWIDRIFNRMLGIYGAQFKSKFSVVVDGVDVGIANAKETWAEELGNFNDKPEAIAYALDHLPVDHAPNALEFRDICRRAPVKQAPQLEYTPTAEDKARHREMSHKATAAVKQKEFDGLLWAKRPKSQVALNAVYDAKKHANRFPALAAVFDRLVTDGIASSTGALIKRWDGCQWVKA
ncbi:MAG: hypothetical protein WBK19_10435 [Azonexus sp.]